MTHSKEHEIKTIAELMDLLTWENVDDVFRDLRLTASAFLHLKDDLPEFKITEFKYKDDAQ